MGKMKHVVAIIIVLTILIGGFIFLLPKLSESQTSGTSEKIQASDTTTTSLVADTLSFEDKMQQALLPLEIS